MCHLNLKVPLTFEFKLFIKIGGSNMSFTRSTFPIVPPLLSVPGSRSSRTLDHLFVRDLVIDVLTTYNVFFSKVYDVHVSRPPKLD